MHSTSAISHKTTTKSVLDLINLYDHGHLNLEPGFQRQSVWHERGSTQNGSGLTSAHCDE
jgi:hypothetical protein